MFSALIQADGRGDLTFEGRVRPGPAPCRRRIRGGSRAGRARGGPTSDRLGHGNVRTRQLRATPAMEMSRSQRPPEASGVEARPRRGQPGIGSATASAQNIATPSCHTTRPPPAAASSPKATRALAARRAPVTGDGDPDLGSAAATSSAAPMPSCSRARVGWPRARRRPGERAHAAVRLPALLRRSSATDRFRPFKRSKNAAGPRRAPSGGVDSTLITDAPGRRQQVAAERAGPQRGEIHDDAGPRSTRRGGPERHRGPRRGAPASRRPATGQPQQAAQATARRCRGWRPHRSPRTTRRAPSTAALSSSSHAGTTSIVVVARERHRHEPLRARKAGSSPAARRAPAPQTHVHGPLAEQGERIEVGEGRANVLDAVDQPLGGPEGLFGRSR